MRIGKKVEYNDRVLQVEHASFTHLIFATNGALGEETERYHAILAEKMSEKLNCTYADTINYIRKKLSFTILKTSLIVLRGHRKKPQYTSCSTRDTNINILCHNQKTFLIEYHPSIDCTLSVFLYTLYRWLIQNPSLVEEGMLGEIKIRHGTSRSCYYDYYYYEYYYFYF